MSKYLNSQEKQDLIQKVIDDVNNNTKNNRCTRCGACCSDTLPVTQEELIIIKIYITNRGINPIRKIEFDSDGDPETINIQCPFYNNKFKKCLIYPVRPEICRRFLCSQPPETIVNNQIDCYENRDNSLFVSMHITFLEDDIFLQVYQEHPEFKNESVSVVKFEIEPD